MGYFSQQALDVLNPDLTIEEQLQRDFPHESIGVLRSLAGAFQFSGDDIDKKIRMLSGGEKTRLVMARMLLNPPNFLVLDEPTNHLDLATKEMLLESLSGFDGTMLFVSHDRAFLRALSNRVLELGGESGHGDGAARVSRLVCRIRRAHGARSAGCIAELQRPGTEHPSSGSSANGSHAETRESKTPTLRAWLAEALRLLNSVKP